MFQVEVVLRVADLGQRHYARILGHLDLFVEDVDDAVNVLVAQAVLVAVLHEAFAGVDHEDASAGGGMLLVEHQDAGRDAGAIEQVGRQADDALDVAAADDILADGCLGVAAEEHPMGQNHRALARAFERLEDVQQEGEVAVLLRRHAILKAMINIVTGVEAGAP